MEYKKQKQNKINEQTKPNQNRNIDTENRVVVTRREEELREGKMGKWGQLYGDRWKLNFWW